PAQPGAIDASSAADRYTAPRLGLGASIIAPESPSPLPAPAAPTSPIPPPASPAVGSTHHATLAPSAAVPPPAPGSPFRSLPPALRRPAPARFLPQRCSPPDFPP